MGVSNLKMGGVSNTHSLYMSFAKRRSERDVFHLLFRKGAVLLKGCVKSKTGRGL